MMTSTEPSTSNASPPPRQKRRRRYPLRGGLTAAALLLGLLLLLGKYWFVPHLLRGQIESLADRYWQGRVSVETVEFNLFGPAVLRGVEGRDDDGRTWITADAVVLHLRDWPGRSPVLDGIEVRRPAVTAYLREGRCVLPLKSPADPSAEPSRYVDIQRVTFADASVRLVEAGRTGTVGGIELLPLAELRLEPAVTASVRTIEYTPPDRLVLRNVRLDRPDAPPRAEVRTLTLEWAPDETGQSGLRRVTVDRPIFATRVRGDRLALPMTWTPNTPAGAPAERSTPESAGGPELVFQKARLHLQGATDRLGDFALDLPGLRYLHLPEELRLHLERGTTSPKTPTVIEDLRLARPGRPAWATANRLVVQQTPGQAGREVIEVRLSKPHLRLHTRDGLLQLPLRLNAPAREQSPESTPDRPAKFDRLVLEDARLDLDELIDAPQADTPPAGADDAADLSGALRLVRVYGNLRARGNVTVRFGQGVRLTGQADADVDLREVRISNLRQLLGAEPLPGRLPTQPMVIGPVRMAGATLRNEVLSVPRLRAETCGGRMRAKATFTFTPGKPFHYKGALRCDDFDLRTFYASWDPNQHVQYGRGSAALDFIEGFGTDLDKLQCSAVLFLDDSDLDRVDLIEDILTVLQLRDKTARTDSDLRAIFRLRDGMISIGQGQFGNPVAGFVVQPGGTIDARTGELDFDVVAGVLRTVSKVPILSTLGNLTGNLTRLHVGGALKDPAISKRPLRDLATGTTGFFKDLLKTGGEIDNILRTAGEK